jgi:hypothetical protein
LAGFSFDAVAWELWRYLTAGASIHIVDAETRTSAPSLVRWLSARRITKEIQRRAAQPEPEGGPTLTRVSREQNRVNLLASNSSTETAKHD